MQWDLDSENPQNMKDTKLKNAYRISNYRLKTLELLQRATG